MKPRKTRPVIDRIAEKLALTDTGCLIWIGDIDHNGYGRISVMRRGTKVHRTLYELVVGPVPKGLDLDHLCRVRHCARPDHLEPVTRRENVMRSSGFPAANVAKTHCPQGHPYSGPNLGRQGKHRHCRACRAASQRRYMARKKATT